MAHGAVRCKKLTSFVLLVAVQLAAPVCATTRALISSHGSDDWADTAKKCPAHRDPEMALVRKQMERLVESNLPGGGDKQVTLLTHGTYDRLEGLKLTLKNWGGPVSVAFFAKSQNEGLKIRKFVKAQSWSPGSTVTLAFAKTKYPINFLRNVALDGARTEWVFPIDMDFTPSIGASEVITEHLPSGESGVLVLPAFEIDDSPMARMKRVMNNEEVDDFPLTKERLLNAGATVFHHDNWAPAHDASESDRWRRESGGTYPIHTGKNAHESYEPYVVVKRKGLPHYDERFDGYGFNKVQWILCLRCSGYKFNVVEDAFVLHAEHKKQAKFLRVSSNRQMKGVMEDFVRELKCPLHIKPLLDAHFL